MKRASLDQFLEFLDVQDPASLRGDSVDRYLGTHKLNPDDFLNFVFFREDRYARNLIQRTKHWELLVLTWLPGQCTPIHDHDGNRCWVTVHTGALTIKSYDCLTDEKKLSRALGPAETVSKGGKIYADDGRGVHSIANASKKPAVSLHLYAGPIDRCRIYDEKTKKFVWKNLTYFTQNGRATRTHYLELPPPEAPGH